MNASSQFQDTPALFQGDLIGPEKILWTGRPGDSSFARALPGLGLGLWFVPWGLISLSLGIVLIFIFFLLLSNLHSLSWALLIPLLCIPYSLIALFLGYLWAVWPFVVRYWKLPNTYYAVTTDRLLILCIVPKRSLRMLAIKDIYDSQSIVCPDKRRTIIFTSDPALLGEKSYFCFVNIQDFGSLDELIDDLRKPTEEDRKQKQLENRYPAKHQPSRWQRPVAAASLLFILIGVIALYFEIRADSLLRRQEFAKRPHTARILGYQITFPKEIPEGYNAGSIDLDYSDDLYDRGQGRQGRTRRATLDLWSPEKAPYPGGIQFMVNEFAQPGLLLKDWQAPPQWKKLQRTSLGTKEIDGVKFAISRCTAEVYYWSDEKIALEKAAKNKLSEKNFLPTPGYKISAVEYLAHDDGKLIGLRGYGYGDHNIIITLTDSALNTFHKVKDGSASADYIKDSPEVDPYGSVDGHTTDPASLVDPYAELIKP